jgi:DNA (cytosine-5)-methyltransferase 1
VTYGSICSGIEATTVAWEPLGWRPGWFAEIDRFCRALLKYRYPEVKNHGDFTRLVSGGGADAVDLLVGGTPCQDFSVAGLRAGLDGSRGKLTLEYLKLARRLRPRWLVWENVPGVLSIDSGRTFGTFFGGLAELGYGFAYRVLDAQYFGVPQRRRRVFVVGYLGDWRAAAAVLFERESMSGHPAPSRKAGKGFTRDVVSCLTGSGRGVERTGETRGQDRVVGMLAYSPDTAYALNAGGTRRIDGESETFIAHALRGEGFDASEDGTGRGIPLVAQTLTRDMYRSGGATAGNNPGIRNVLSTASAVRRLTPRECERLQGFPDDYTLIPHRGKPAADGPRYKALGNSMAVPVMAWIGKRIEMVEHLSAVSRKPHMVCKCSHFEGTEDFECNTDLI